MMPDCTYKRATRGDGQSPWNSQEILMGNGTRARKKTKARLIW